MINAKLPDFDKRFKSITLLDPYAVSCVIHVMSFFNDMKKTSDWFLTKNPILGYTKPQTMILMGRSKKLLKIIQDLQDGNIP